MKWQGRPGSEAWFMWNCVKLLKMNVDQMKIWKRDKRPPTKAEEKTLRECIARSRAHLNHMETFLDGGFPELEVVKPTKAKKAKPIVKKKKLNKTLSSVL